MSKDCPDNCPTCAPKGVLGEPLLAALDSAKAAPVEGDGRRWSDGRRWTAGEEVQIFFIVTGYSVFFTLCGGVLPL